MKSKTIVIITISVLVLGTVYGVLLSSQIRRIRSQIEELRSEKEEITEEEKEEGLKLNTEGDLDIGEGSIEAKDITLSGDLIYESESMIKNLNAEYVGGYTIEELIEGGGISYVSYGVYNKIPGLTFDYFGDLRGTNLTSLNATELLSGIVPMERIQGAYTGITGLGGVTFSGDVVLNYNELKLAALENLIDFPTGTVEGQMFWHTGNNKAYWYDETDDRWWTGGDAATVVVAASDSENKEKADYICDGVDDQVTIESAINSLPSGGGKVELLEGNYSITEPISITSNNVSIEGHGNNTVLTEADGIPEANYGVIEASSCERFVLRNLQIDGNKSGQSGYTLSPGTVNTDYVTYGLVENCHIYDSTGDGIQPVYSNNITIQSNHIHDCDEHAIHLNGVINGWVLNNYLHDDGNSLIAQGHGGIRNVVIAHNILERAFSSSFMIQVSGNDTAADMRERCYVVDNIMNLDEGLGITVAENASHILIAYNDIKNGGGRIVDVQSGATDVRILYNDAENSSRGIRLYGSHHYVVGNSFRNTEEKGNYTFEIYGDHHIIKDNKIDGIAYYGYSPIELYATYSQVIGNYCRQRYDRPWSEYAIEEKESADYNYISENELRDGTWSITPILKIGANTKVENNFGYFTETSGTATIPNGQTSVDVTHNLATTPAAQDIQVTATNDLGNATKFWISDLGASTFRINVDADPGASTATFSWDADVD